MLRLGCGRPSPLAYLVRRTVLLVSHRPQKLPCHFMPHLPDIRCNLMAIDGCRCQVQSQRGRGLALANLQSSKTWRKRILESDLLRFFGAAAPKTERRSLRSPAHVFTGSNPFFVLFLSFLSQIAPTIIARNACLSRTLNSKSLTYPEPQGSARLKARMGRRYNSQPREGLVRPY